MRSSGPIGARERWMQGQESIYDDTCLFMPICKHMPPRAHLQVAYMSCHIYEGILKCIHQSFKRSGESASKNL